VGVNQQLLDNNYIVVKNFLDPSVAHSLGLEFEQYILQYGANDPHGVNDPQCPKSLSCYNFLPFVRTQVEQIGQMQEVVGENLLPTYVYSRLYKNGEILARHKDRPACEVSVTLCMKKTSDWTIFIKTPEGKEVGVELEEGDAMVYRGMVAEHWREPFQGDNNVQLFMHYVESHGQNAWAFYDLRKDINDPMPPR
jgi:hypothetical protein